MGWIKSALTGGVKRFENSINRVLLFNHYVTRILIGSLPLLAGIKYSINAVLKAFKTSSRYRFHSSHLDIEAFIWLDESHLNRCARQGQRSCWARHRRRHFLSERLQKILHAMFHRFLCLIIKLRCLMKWERNNRPLDALSLLTLPRGKLFWTLTQRRNTNTVLHRLGLSPSLFARAKLTDSCRLNNNGN